MQVTEKTDKLNNCSCGNSIDNYTIGYGRTPYVIHCIDCKKHTNLSEIKVTGSPLNIIDFWNRKISTISIECIKSENSKLMNKKRNQNVKNEWNYYDFFWVDKKGILISKGY